MAIARFLDRICLALRASGLWLCYTTKCYPFLSSTLAQSQERKGSNFAIWQPCSEGTKTSQISTLFAPVQKVHDRRLPNAGSGEEAARLGRLAVVLLARVRGEALPQPQGLVGATSDLDNTFGEELR